MTADDRVTTERPALPNKADWSKFKASRNGFEPGTCEHCLEPADKLILVGTQLVCHSCREWLRAHKGTR